MSVVVFGHMPKYHSGGFLGTAGRFGRKTAGCKWWPAWPSTILDLLRECPHQRGHVERAEKEVRARQVALEEEKKLQASSPRSIVCTSRGGALNSAEKERRLAALIAEKKKNEKGY